MNIDFYSVSLHPPSWSPTNIEPLSQWICHFAECFQGLVEEGMVAHGWPELSSWLQSCPSLPLSPSLVEKVEATSKAPDEYVRCHMDFDTLYTFNSAAILMAFLWTSFSRDDFPLLLFPKKTRDEDFLALLRILDRPRKDYSSLEANIGWFVETYDPRESLSVCIASRDAAFVEQIRQQFKESIGHW